MTNAGDVTVVVVNFNGGTLLDDCLLKLSFQTVQPKHILLMDNGSSDGTVERAEIKSGVTIHKLKANLGFAKANNLALANCNTEFFALLNPDALADSMWLENLLKVAHQHPEISVFGSRQMMVNRPNTLDGTGDIYHLTGYVQRSGYGRSLTNNDLQSKSIFSACACAALYRTAAFKKVGGFDEDYFCYLEDVDLGFRMQLMGFKALYCPDAVVFHVGSVSTGGNRSDFSIYHGQRNLIWTFIKNMPGILFWILLPLHLALNFFSIFYFIFKGKGKVACKSKWDALKSLGHVWKKRRQIQMNRTVSALDIWRLLDKRLRIK